MARIEAIDPSQAEPRVRAVLEAQQKDWGAPLNNHLVYARCPPSFMARGRCGAASVRRD